MGFERYILAVSLSAAGEFARGGTYDVNGKGMVCRGRAGGWVEGENGIVIPLFSRGRGGAGRKRERMSNSLCI